MSEEQKQAMYALVGAALEEKGKKAKQLSTQMTMMKLYNTVMKEDTTI